MAVYLGQGGRIKIGRTTAGEAYRSVVNEPDVNVTAKRFSVDFAYAQFITGDYIEIKTVDGSNLNWINATKADSAFSAYINIDPAGGVRLFTTFEASLINDTASAVALKSPSKNQECTFKIYGSGSERCLADVRSYQLTTSRNTIDTTHLGAQFRKQYEAGLIQGQGQIECLWAYSALCGDNYGTDEVEFSSYLARLCLRLVHGASFQGQFFVYYGGDNDQRSVWYESQHCVITNVAISVSPDQAVISTIDFVTNGPIELREGYVPGLIELEQNGFDIQLEQFPSGLALENPN